jgi:hypothetical protein
MGGALLAAMSLERREAVFNEISVEGARRLDNVSRAVEAAIESFTSAVERAGASSAVDVTPIHLLVREEVDPSRVFMVLKKAIVCSSISPFEQGHFGRAPDSSRLRRALADHRACGLLTGIQPLLK